MKNEIVKDDDWGDDNDPKVDEAIEQHMEENFAPGVHIPWEALEANIIADAKILYGALSNTMGFESPNGLLISDEELKRWSYIAKGKIPGLLKLLAKRGLIVFMGFEELEDGSHARRVKKGVINNE